MIDTDSFLITIRSNSHPPGCSDIAPPIFNGFYIYIHYQKLLEILEVVKAYEQQAETAGPVGPERDQTFRLTKGQC